MKTLLSRFLPAARTAAPAGDGIVVEGGAQVFLGDVLGRFFAGERWSS